jgi:hypothetical protein
VVRHIFQAYPVWIYTQSNITSITFNILLTSCDIFGYKFGVRHNALTISATNRRNESKHTSNRMSKILHRVLSWFWGALAATFNVPHLCADETLLCIETSSNFM